MLKKLPYLILILFTTQYLVGQELDDLDKLLNVEVANPDPSYMPVIGVGVGLLNYFGDVKNNYNSVTTGELGYKFNISFYIDDNRYYRGNVFGLLGNLSGNQYDHEDLTKNFNFSTEVVIFGLNVDYDFDHLIGSESKFHPYISIGIENILFNSKIDSLNNEDKYVYLPNGLISNESGRFIERDFVVDTDLKSGSDKSYILAIPFEIGFDFQITDRMMFRFGSSINYTLDDYIDQVNDEPTNPYSSLNRFDFNDFFTYTYFTLNLDLFSEDKLITYRKLFAEIDDFDYEMFGDEDNDYVPDIQDKCLGTPFGVEVDSTGCPLDDDNDGVPNFRDKEPNSAKGALVDEDGVEISEERLIAMLDNSDAVRREDIELYIRDKSSYAKYYRKTNIVIPEKFKFLDSDDDSYISFEEMLDAIDMYFDFEAELTSDDIYELNGLFFSQ